MNVIYFTEGTIIGMLHHVRTRVVLVYLAIHL